MNRGSIGVLPRPTKLEDESYLEFITSFRRLAIQEMFPKVAEHGEAALTKALDKGEIAKPSEGQAIPLGDIKNAFGKNPVTPTFQRFVRSQQEMMWRRTRESFYRNIGEVMAYMDDAETNCPERIHIDPSFVEPDYTRREIHCQPGGYTADPMGGIVFHYGTKVFTKASMIRTNCTLNSPRKRPSRKIARLSAFLILAVQLAKRLQSLRTFIPTLRSGVWMLANR